MSNEAPKMIWLDDNMIAWKHYSEDDTPYIRKDIVDGLVDALEELMYANTDKAETLAEAALKAWEEA